MMIKFLLPGELSLNLLTDKRTAIFWPPRDPDSTRDWPRVVALPYLSTRDTASATPRHQYEDNRTRTRLTQSRIHSLFISTISLLVAAQMTDMMTLHQLVNKTQLWVY